MMVLDVEPAELTCCNSCTLLGLLGAVEDFVEDALLRCTVGLLLCSLLFELLLSSRKGSFERTDARLGCDKRLGVADNMSALDNDEGGLALGGSSTDFGPLLERDRAKRSLGHALTGSAVELSGGELVKVFDVLDGCAELVEVGASANTVSGNFGGGVSHCGSSGDDEEADDEDEESNHFFIL
jgi:hypothetical protein